VILLKRFALGTETLTFMMQENTLQAYRVECCCVLVLHIENGNVIIPIAGNIILQHKVRVRVRVRVGFTA